MCFESHLHLYIAFEAVFVLGEVEKYQEAVKHIAKKVTELIGKEVMKQKGLA